MSDEAKKAVFNPMGHISKSPTIPGKGKQYRDFDVAQLFEGPCTPEANNEVAPSPLDEKLRQAYFWVVNTAIISPHYDVEYNEGPPTSMVVGDSKRSLTLPSAQSYSSYVLLPLLTFAVRGKCLFIGGPGRGKTASALLMGVLAGYPVKEVKRSMQHGHPQMTIADLLGNPLPADLVNAKSMDDIQIAWRSWLSMRVKIIDEYNRIPTRTQSALLTVMGDNYAEVLNHIYECPESAWYLTANDDKGGGTYEVVEALRDRIDVVVQALAFNPRFLEELLVRVENKIRPEEFVPSEIIFTQEEVDRMGDEIRSVAVPPDVLRRIEFFASQFEFFETAGTQFEYMTKDTAHVSGAQWRDLVSADNGRDRLKDLGCQTMNGLSVRNLMTLLLYAKAVAYFRGNKSVSLDDVRQILPFVLQDKLHADLDSPFFDLGENTAYKADRIGWLRYLFDSSCQEFVRLNLDEDDPVRDVHNEFAKGLEGLSHSVAHKRLVNIEQLIRSRAKEGKLYGHVYDDLLKLKYLHQRYTNYLNWLKEST